MREIKFRAWVVANTFHEAHMIHDFEVYNGHYSLSDEFGYLIQEDYPLMQYTGLKDKNGVEIYEGDMCHFKNRYDGEYTNAIVYYKNGFYLDDGLHSNWDAEDCGVVGNIYENPELLKENE